MATMDSIQKIWPQVPIGAVGTPPPEYSRLLQYFTTACEAVSVSAPTALYAAKDLRDTLDLLAKMRQLVAPNTPLSGMSRRSLVDGLKQSPGPRWRSADEIHVLNTLCLALSLWLTLEIVPAGTGTPGSRKLEWKDTSTVLTLIEDAFPEFKPAPGAAPETLDSRLTLEYLESYHRFEFLFTDNLAEHLDLVSDDDSKPVLVVYKHKIFLWNELRHTQVSPLPRALVEETLDTLNLLLPYKDRHAIKFLTERNMIDLNGLGLCGRPFDRNLDLGNYKYWGEKLARLSAIVVKGPTGVRQLKPGRGPGVNMRDFVNFWIAVVVLAILTVGFGTASIVLAVLQYNLGKLQYDLSLAQACATMNSTELPGFCP